MILLKLLRKYRAAKEFLLVLKKKKGKKEKRKTKEIKIREVFFAA